MIKKMSLRVVGIFVGVVLAMFGLAACSTDATVTSDNLSKAADQFEVNRRVVFFNGITDKYLLEIEGLCAIVDDGSQLEVTCKIGDDGYKKHFLGLSDNVSYFIEHLEPNKSDPYHYRVVFKPETIIPDIDLKTSSSKEK